MFSNLILFYRRLIVLIATFIVVLLVLVFQLWRLTLSEGEARYEKAMGRLHSTSYLPTWRGRITDRKNRVLAEDVASYAVSVDWDVITGDRAIRYAREDAKTSIGSERWKSISPDDRQAFVDAYLPARLSELNDFWALVSKAGNLPREELERTLDIIREEVEHTAHVVWARQEEVHKKRYGDSVEFIARPIKEQREPHVVLTRVSDETAIVFELLGQQFDNVVHVEHSRQREYKNRIQNVVVSRATLPREMRRNNSIEVSLDDVAELIVGDVRKDVWEEDIKNNPFRSNGEVNLSGYRAGDEVGKSGLEQSLENSLRGLRGRVVRHRNGDELVRVPVQGGKDVQITLDIKLQARVEGVLSPELGLMKVQEWHRNTHLPVDTPLRGAVVVLDIETSEVLAMASTPALRDEEDVDGYPWLNRAAEGLYPPGSIIKPLVLAAAITESELKPDESIECVGHFFKDVKDAARCWIYRPVYKNRTHGYLKSVEAIARSCNIFFYELGTRMGFEKLLEWLQRFGMSQPVASQLSSNTSTGTLGHVPSEEEIESLRAQGALAFETISISIGQGALTWSPLHAAAAYATLARGGVWIPPSLVVGLQHEETDLHLNKDGVTVALEGLHDSISKKYGTGSRIRYGADNSEPTFTIQGVRLWGKTGTAEAPPYRLNKESEPISGLDHSWFLVMASDVGGSEPKVVVAVLVEHGGSGGRVAGPIANQILYSLQSEGYLEGESQ
ncbi:MAG: hypothetical protein H8E83_01445 [Planctomycetes bacterium]|nr:hypothetical protein [Planctomycetota bacterium]